MGSLAKRVSQRTTDTSFTRSCSSPPGSRSTSPTSTTPGSVQLKLLYNCRQRPQQGEKFFALRTLLLSRRQKFLPQTRKQVFAVSHSAGLLQKFYSRLVITGFQVTENEARNIGS